MRYIFIPIHHGLHFMCAVINMDQMKIKYYNSLRYDNVTRQGCRHKVKIQEDTLQVLRDYLQNKHMEDKHIDLPNEWKLCTMSNVPQHNTTNTTDCGVFACMYCDFILNDCKLDFNQDNITISHWRERMILSILLVKPKNDKEKNNDDKVTLSAIKMKWNNKQKNIARASTWSPNLIMKKDCKANKNDKMDGDDDCNGRLDCKNKRVQNFQWKKVEVKHTKNGKGSSLFSMEDIEKDDCVIQYMGNNEYKRGENNYVMKFNGMNLWINGDIHGGPAQYINHLCNPNCELVQWGVDGLTRMCLFAKKKIKSGMELNFDYN
jgi:hypothetical protein